MYFSLYIYILIQLLRTRRVRTPFPRALGRIYLIESGKSRYLMPTQKLIRTSELQVYENLEKGGWLQIHCTNTLHQLVSF